MKSLLRKLRVIFIGLVIFSYTEVWGADWRVIGEPTVKDVAVLYYDADSITHPSKNIVRTWTKKIYSKSAVTRYVKEMGKRFENLSYAVELYEVNCIEKKILLLESTAYSKDGDVIISAKSQATKWSSIVPGSMGEALFGSVCK